MQNTRFSKPGKVGQIFVPISIKNFLLLSIMWSLNLTVSFLKSILFYIFSCIFMQLELPYYRTFLYDLIFNLLISNFLRNQIFTLSKKEKSCLRSLSSSFARGHVVTGKERVNELHTLFGNLPEFPSLHPFSLQFQVILFLSSVV